MCSLKFGKLQTFFGNLPAFLEVAVKMISIYLSARLILRALSIGFLLSTWPPVKIVQSGEPRILRERES